MNENADVTKKRGEIDDALISGFLGYRSTAPVPEWWYKLTPSQMSPAQRGYFAAYTMEEVQNAFGRRDTEKSNGD